MLPPLDPATADTNPRFEALYNDLCKTKLQADGASMLDIEAQKARDAFEAGLLKAREHAASKDIVVSALKAIAYNADAIPNQLHEVVVIMAALLDGQIAGDDLDTVQECLSDVKTHLPTITAAISRHIEEHSKTVALLTALDTSRADTTPQEVISSWLDLITTARNAILQSRFEQTTYARQVHEAYRQMIETCIRILEQVVHGSVARSTKAKADYLSTVAEGMSRKLEVQYVQILAQLDSDDTRKTLQDRKQELSKINRQLKGQIRDRQDELDEWRGRQSSNAAAHEYAAVLKQTRLLRTQHVS